MNSISAIHVFLIIFITISLPAFGEMTLATSDEANQMFDHPATAPLKLELEEGMNNIPENYFACVIQNIRMPINPTSGYACGTLVDGHNNYYVDAYCVGEKEMVHLQIDRKDPEHDKRILDIILSADNENKFILFDGVKKCRIPKNLQSVYVVRDLIRSHISSKDQ